LPIPNQTRIGTLSPHLTPGSAPHSTPTRAAVCPSSSSSLSPSDENPVLTRALPRKTAIPPPTPSKTDQPPTPPSAALERKLEGGMGGKRGPLTRVTHHTVSKIFRTTTATTASEVSPLPAGRPRGDHEVRAGVGGVGCGWKKRVGWFCRAHERSESAAYGSIGRSKDACRFRVALQRLCFTESSPTP
jgi:hypothetical protein